MRKNFGQCRVKIIDSIDSTLSDNLSATEFLLIPSQHANSFRDLTIRIKSLSFNPEGNTGMQ